MKKDSNGYIFLYATIIVILVAVLLAFAATYLKPFQVENQEADKRLAILSSVGLATDVSNQSDKKGYLKEQFGKYITEQFAVNTKGERVQADAFQMDFKTQLDNGEKGQLPLFVAKLDNGAKKYIFPLAGAGLWGPIWGYISLDDDLATVYGTNFSHASETPGLGAEIATPMFQDKFKTKKITDASGTFVSIAVVKAGVPLDDNKVDGISGGTMTSQGVAEMLKNSLKAYEPFISIEKRKGSSNE